ncbi:uncharacterized protein LOC111546494 [Piliocolobus tephrosceles]|uniref:uncharacterized protein LOC111546494 n=1 Tax=Piliocolobus tephrosceles TaxID=591936 RepID=UPI000E6B2535|nr:uncharacterized protein LOC111546494 [Piliocolobus tephrosceles]
MKKASMYICKDGCAGVINVEQLNKALCLPKPCSCHEVTSLSLHICWAAMAPSITSSQDSIPSQTDKKGLSLDLSLTRKKRYQGLHWSHWQGLNHMAIKIHTPGQGSPSLGQNWSWGNREEKGVTQQQMPTTGTHSLLPCSSEGHKEKPHHFRELWCHYISIIKGHFPFCQPPHWQQNVPGGFLSERLQIHLPPANPAPGQLYSLTGVGLADGSNRMGNGIKKCHPAPSPEWKQIYVTKFTLALGPQTRCLHLVVRCSEGRRKGLSPFTVCILLLCVMSMHLLCGFLVEYNFSNMFFASCPLSLPKLCPSFKPQLMPSVFIKPFYHQAAESTRT